VELGEHVDDNAHEVIYGLDQDRRRVADDDYTRVIDERDLYDRVGLHRIRIRIETPESFKSRKA